METRERQWPRERERATLSSGSLFHVSRLDNVVSQTQAHDSRAAPLAYTLPGASVIRRSTSTRYRSAV